MHTEVFISIIKHIVCRKYNISLELISHFSVILLFLQNIPYGRNDCTLDLYHPNVPRPEGGYMSMPVVIFVYGGAWGSGDKNMYGPLCVEIANRLNAVVCCPNLSIYPKVLYSISVKSSRRNVLLF